MSQTKAQLISDLVQALNFTGTATAPANGAFLSATNTLALATNSAQRLTIDSSGRLGIGTTSPNTKLDVRDPSATGISSRSTTTQATDTNKGLKVRNNSDTDTFSVSYKGQGYFAGNVGIGTTSPSTKLHVQQSAVSNAPSRSSALYLENNANCEIQFVGNSSNDCQLRFGTSSNSFKGAIEYELDNNNFEFYTNGTERMRIDSSGRLLLGTTTASAFTDRLLTVASSGGAGIEMRAGTSSISQLSFSDGSGNDTSGYRGFISYQHASDLMQIGVAASARINITSAGNVGIGTASPGAPLTIDTGGTEDALRIGNSAGTDTSIRLGSTSTSIDTHGVIKYDKDDNYLSLLVSGESHGSGGILIANGGNVGIGTSSPSRKLEINSGIFDVVAKFVSSDSAATINLVDGLNADGVTIGSINGNMTFRSGLSTERMRIDTSGNLLIGTTTLEDTTGNSGPKIINTGDITIDGNRKALVFRSTQSSAHQMSGIQWWNEIGAGVQCAIHGIREAITKAPGALAFYTSNDVDTSANNGEGNITEAMRIDSNQRILLGTTVSEDTTGNSGTKVISGGDITIDGDQKAFIFRSSASAAQIQSGIQWWNENGAGVMAKIHCIRSAINNAPGDLAFFTNTDVDTNANNSEGDITERMRILSTGEVDIYSAYTNPVGGTTRDLYVRSDGRLGYLSSIRASKTNIVDLTDISWLNNLKPKAFNIRKKNDSGEYTDNYYNELEYGLIAEDVESVNKELCSYSSDNALEAVQYRKLVVPLLKAVQELTARVAALEAA